MLSVFDAGSFLLSAHVHRFARLYDFRCTAGFALSDESNKT